MYEPRWSDLVSFAQLGAANSILPPPPQISRKSPLLKHPVGFPFASHWRDCIALTRREYAERKVVIEVTLSLVLLRRMSKIGFGEMSSENIFHAVVLHPIDRIPLKWPFFVTLDGRHAGQHRSEGLKGEKKSKWQNSDGAKFRLRMPGRSRSRAQRVFVEKKTRVISFGCRRHFEGCN